MFRMKKRIITVLVVACVMGFLFIGCSKKQSGGSIQATLSFWKGPNSEREAELWAVIINKFHVENPDIKIEHLVTPWDTYTEKYTAAFAGGTPPDVFHLGDLFYLSTRRNFGPGTVPWKITRFFLFGVNSNFMNWFKNSFVVGILGTLLSLFVCLFAAYAFAKKQFPGKIVLFTMIMATMIVPGTVTLFPTFKVVKFFGMINTLPGVFITSIANVFGMMMLKQYMEGIPNSIIESAIIDGANEYKIFFRIMLPMCTSVSALMVIWCFMGHWNNLLWPLVIINTESLKTLPVGIAGMKGRSNSAWNLIMSATMLSLAPIVFVFLVFRRKFIEGMTVGAVKG